MKSSLVSRVINQNYKEGEVKMIYGFKVEGKEACFVIELSDTAEKKALSINLYAKDEATYSEFYGVIKPLETEIGLENKDPDGHELIHTKMGEIMACDPDSTKTFTTHFHWVCAKPMDMDALGGFFQALIKAKKLTRAQVGTAMGACFQ
jgi:hypothetical protein